MDDNPDQKIKMTTTTATDRRINSKIEDMNEEGYRLKEFQDVDGYRVAMIFEKDDLPKENPQKDDIPALTTAQREMLEEIIESVDKDEYDNVVFKKLKGKLLRGLVYD